MASAGSSGSSSDGSGLHWIDWSLIGLYAASTIYFGWRVGRRQGSTREYFIGSGNIHPMLIGVSLFATLLSTVTYLSMPGEMIGKGPALMASVLAYPIVFVIVAFLMLPVYLRTRVTSAYELLEERLGLGIRTLGACMFVVTRLVWMSLLTYLAARAMTVMLGVDVSWQMPLIGWTLTELEIIVLVTGLVAVIYTSLGGLRAVVVTDLLQTILLLGGALLVVVTITIDRGGFSWFPSAWHPNWDSQPVFSWDPRERVTLFGSMLTAGLYFVCTLGGDQVSVQRFMATRDVAAARRALAAQLIVTATVAVTLSFVGLSLLGYFTAHPDRLSGGLDLKDDADHLFPLYISQYLPIGVSGLVVSAMFAAAMSSIDSGINSITAVVSTDFIDRFGRPIKSERGQVIFAKVLAFVIGALVVVGSSFMGAVPGNITAVANKTNNLLMTPMFALFFFAFFVPFAKPLAVWIAAACGVTTGLCIAYSGPIVGALEARLGIPAEVFGVSTVDGVTSDPVSFQWIAPAALAINLSVGTLLSLLLSRRK